MRPLVLLAVMTAGGGMLSAQRLPERLNAVPQQAPAFRAVVDMVALSVTVTGPDGRYVPGLAASDFTVLEDGVRQQVLLFERATNPLTVSLLIDSSTSMTEQMTLAQQAAIEFVSKLRPQDLVEVIDFDSRVRILQTFTNDRRALELAISSATVGGSTSMHEAIFLALGRQENERGRLGVESRREVIVVLTDGADNSPRVRFEPLMTMVKRFPAVIYPIGLGLDEPPGLAFSRWAAESEANLRTLARDTGGRLMVANVASELAGVYASIADELNNQYLLGYAPRAGDRETWRAVSVRATRPDVDVRTRTGYFYTPR
jgi:Ca-activated chloride channel family protein